MKSTLCNIGYATNIYDIDGKELKNILMNAKGVYCDLEEIKSVKRDIFVILTEDLKILSFEGYDNCVYISNVTDYYKQSSYSKNKYINNKSNDCTEKYNLEFDDNYYPNELFFCEVEKSFYYFYNRHYDPSEYFIYLNNKNFIIMEIEHFDGYVLLRNYHLSFYEIEQYLEKDLIINYCHEDFFDCVIEIYKELNLDN